MKNLTKSLAAALASSLVAATCASAAPSIYLEGNAFDSEANPTSVYEYPNGPLPGKNQPASVSMSYGSLGTVTNAGAVEYGRVRLSASGSVGANPDRVGLSTHVKGISIDSLTINAPGQVVGQSAGIAVVEYLVAGAMSSSGPSSSVNDGHVDYYYRFRMPGGFEGTHRLYPDGTPATGPGFAPILNQKGTIRANFNFGTPFEFTVEMTNTASIRAGNQTKNVNTETTVRIVEVLDTNGNPITDYTVTSESGFDYTAAPGSLWAAGRDMVKNEKPDFATEANATNATVPQWSYGYRASVNSTDLTLFSSAEHFNDRAGLPLDGFDTGDAYLLVSTSTEPFSYTLGSGALKPILPEQIVTHPSTSKWTVVRWTAPAAGRYNILARWLDLDKNGGDGVSCRVVVKGQSIFAQDIPNDGVVSVPLQTPQLNAGDFVDFLVAPGGTAEFDTTGFNAAISLAPAVEIAVAGAENGRATVGQGSNVSVSATIPIGNAPRSVELRDNGRVVGRDESAPYEFTIENIESGLHRIQAVAMDARGVEGASNEIDLTVAQAGPSAAAVARGKGETTDRAAASTGGYTYFFNAQSGSWDEPNNWFRLPDFNVGVPGRNDDAFITYFKEGSGGATVTINRKIEVKTLTVGSENKLMAQPGSLRFEVGVTARNAVYLSDAALEGFELFIEPGAEFTQNFENRFTNMVIFNNGDITYTGPGKTIGDSLTEMRNNGTVKVQRPPASNIPTQVVLPVVQHNGGSLIVNSNTSLIAASLVGNNGNTLIGMDGASILNQNGANILSQNGTNLVGPDGASLVGPDGASLIGMDGASIISRDGAGLEKDATGARIERRQAAATGETGFVLNGGTVGGDGKIIGDLTNRGGFVSPGNSAGTLRVEGNYRQEENGAMVLELGGTNANTFDKLDVTGTATLAGKLIVKTINGFTPQSIDTMSPLTYGSVNGGFSSVSSNAQVNFGANGMTMQVSGANPPAPKALNIATRMRVETGDNVLIAGFIITGSQPKKVLVRGIGPSLPVNGALADPTLDLDAGTFFNDNWRSDQQGEIQGTTIAPSNDLESAIVATLDPGAHTAVLRGRNDGTGVGLVEVYDLEAGTPVQLANISTRGQVQTGDNVMIGGFIIAGEYPAKVLLRAIGPSLPIEGALQDPTLELVDSNGATISNDDWRASQEAEIIATTVAPAHDREAAIVATLVPGAYTAVVRGKDETVGVALVEGYTLP